MQLTKTGSKAKADRNFSSFHWLQCDKPNNNIKNPSIYIYFFRLPKKAKDFRIRCGSDGKYEIPPDYVWPVCRTDKEHQKECHCLGDPDITDPEVCMNIENGECTAKDSVQNQNKLNHKINRKKYTLYNLDK